MDATVVAPSDEGYWSKAPAASAPSDESYWSKATDSSNPQADVDQPSREVYTAEDRLNSDQQIAHATDTRPVIQRGPNAPGRFDLGPSPVPSNPGQSLFRQEVEQQKGAPLAITPAGAVPVPEGTPVGAPPKPMVPGLELGTDHVVAHDPTTGAVIPSRNPLDAGRPITEEDAAQRAEFGKQLANPEQVGNQIAPGFGSMADAPVELAKGNVKGAAIKALGGAGEFGAMAIAPEALEIAASAEFGPAIKLAVALGGGQAGDSVIRKVGAERGWKPEDIELASQAVQWLPAGIYAGARMAGVKTVGGEIPKAEPGTDLPSEAGVNAPEPGTKFKGVTAFPDKETGRPRVAAGVSTSPEGERTAAVRVGETSIGIDLSRKGAKPSEESYWKPAAEAPEGESERPVVQASANPEELRKSAAAQQPDLEQSVKAVTSQVPGTDLEGSRVKDSESQANKEDRGKPNETNIDHLGARVSAETPEARAKVEQAVRDQLPVVSEDKIDANHTDATQFGIKTGEKGDANQVSELQVVDKPMAEAMKETDSLYDQQKQALAVGDEQKAHDIGTQIAEIHKAAQAQVGDEDDLEQARRGAAAQPEVPSQLSTNGVPKEQRASTQIARDEQQKMGERIAGRNETKAAIEKPAEEKPTKYKFGNTQANIPDNSEAAQSLNTVRQRISKLDLAGKGKDIGDGGNHVTVRYGIQGEDTEGIKRYIESLSPFDASLGKTETFPPSEHSDGAAVIQAPINSPELHKINGEIQKHGDFAPSSFPDYAPHATIAYVKPEKAQRYVGMTVTNGKKFHVDQIAIAKKDGSQEIVKLKGAGSAAGPSAVSKTTSEGSSPSAPAKAPEHPITLPAEAQEELKKPGSFIGVDLDKTLAKYDEWKGKTNIGEPIENTVNQVKQWLAEGKNVKIFTARVADDPGGVAKRAIEDWTEKHLGKRLDVTHEKSPHMVAQVDDRGIHVAPNEGIPTGGEHAVPERRSEAIAPRAAAKPILDSDAYRAIQKSPQAHEFNRATAERKAEMMAEAKKELATHERSPAKFTVKKADVVPTEEGSYEARPQEPVKKEPIASLIDAIYNKLVNGESLGNVTELNRLADESLGQGWRTGGDFTPKDVFDAMEAGINKYLLDNGKVLMTMDTEKGLGVLRRNLMDRITSQGVRTEEQITHQQFSTPPTESYVVSKVAGIRPDDVVLEPSAGNGGLAVFAKAIGAEVHVNEIAPRRQKMLEAIGFGKPTGEDGEIINATLDPKIKPTVVLMNPPFSSKALASGPAKNRSVYGFNHVDSALQRLAPGGRLVAILGGGRDGFQNEGASLNNTAAREWFEKIAPQYNVRANIRISGKEYQKYGTSYATRIIVIDKDGPTPDLMATQLKDVSTLEEAYNALRKVAESRPQGGSNVADRGVGLQSPGGARKAESIERVGAGENAGVPSVRSGAGRSGEPSPEVPATVRPAGAGTGVATPRPSGRGEQPAVHSERAGPEKPVESEAAGSTRASTADGDAQRQVAERGLDLEIAEAKAAREEEGESSYTPYQPTLKGAEHPGSIVETKSMATVPMPPLTYKPNLPESVVGKSPKFDDAKLSAVQLEAVSIAGMQNDIILPNGARASALIGDGTGVGKGREAAAILWDNWRKGRTRLVWMTKSKDLINDAVRDLEALGAKDLAKQIRNLGKTDASTPIDHKGVLFTTYSLFRSGDKKGNTRATQVDRWLRGDDDGDGGYMLMDESHNLKNAVVSQGQQASQIGQTVKKFLENMPKLRTVSLSATAATDVMNLGYLDRLGLWGPATPFPGGFVQFAGEIANGGMSAMEMIARELKAQGKYVARTLTFKGVKYSEIKHTITPEQKEIYGTAAQAWRDIFQSIEHTITNTTNGGGRQKAMAMSQFFSTQQRFFNLLLTSIKIPTAVKTAEEALAEGRSVAITLINTNEAAQNREKDRVAAEDSDEEPDYDFGPGRMLSDMVREHYPTQQYKDDVDANGNPIKVPAVDAKGNPVQNPEAVKAREALLAKLDQLAMPNNPLDELIEQLGGPSKVAELTGRKQRFDASKNRLVNRGGSGVTQDKVNVAEMDAYQSGKKRIAILSSAADTGISLHADKSAKNQQPRLCITLQVGWSADKALQMMGRFNRSNQVHPPEYALLKTDAGGESRFISSIARRMESLEALSKGQTKTNVGTEAMSKVNFETDQGRAASTAFYMRLLNNGEVPGTVGADGKPLRGREILKELRVLKGTSGGGQTVPPADRPNVTRLLNRLLALPLDVQQPVYDYFYDIFGATVQDAIDNGSLDTGVKRIPGDSFDVKEFKTLATDPATGAHTFYYPVDAQVRTMRKSVADAEKIIARTRKDGDKPIIFRSKTGKLVLAVPARKIVHADGTSEEAVHVVRPENGVPEKVPLARYEKMDYSSGFGRGVRTWEPVDKEAADKIEQLQEKVEQSARDIERYTEWATDNPAHYQQKIQSSKAENKQVKLELVAAEKQAKSTDLMDLVRDEWQKTYDEAPSHLTSEHHLIGGAVMRYWNAIREASGERLDVYSTVDQKTKQRVVGVEIPASQIHSLLARIAGGKSTVNAEQIVADVLKNATAYELEGGIKVRRGRVAGSNVVQLVTADPNIQKNLKDMGVLYEKGLQPIYYLPTDRYDSTKGKDILDKVLAEYPAKTNEPSAPAETPSGGVTLRSGFLDPELFKQIFPDVSQKFKDWVSDSPTPAKEQKAMMRETRGEKDRQVAIQAERLKQVQRAWRLRSRDESIDFFNSVESGTVQSLPERDRKLAQTFKDAFDQMKDELHGLKPELLRNYIENYFPHIWERPSRAVNVIRQIMSGKRPFAGSGAFLKKRTIPTIQDGLNLGFKPVSWNPVDLFMLKYNEMAQFLMAHKTLEMMKDAGTAEYVKAGEDHPQGWTQLDDRISTVWRRATIVDDKKLDDNTFNLTWPGAGKKTAQPAVFRDDVPSYSGMVIAGHYYAPPDAARVFNNFVSKGMAGRSAIFDAANWLNSNLNALQLGISAFHATTTTVNAATSDIALGIQEATQGKLSALKDLGQGLTVVPSLISTLRNGSHLMREYLNPGSYEKFAKEAEAVATAGGRIKQNTVEVSALDKVVNDFRNGAIAEGLSHIPGAIIHATTWPVMNYYVPRMKMGAFYDMAHNILDTATKEGWSQDQTRDRMQKAWDSIDNRFGQMVYDNLFWNKALRDSLMLATRSVGWNYGTIRELGGAPVDFVREGAKAAGGEKPEVTDRMAFAFALAAFTALMGAALTRLWTGKAPDTWKDYYYPKTEDGTRVSIPGYMKDVFSYGHHPVNTVANKMGPLAEMTSEAIQNRDFYGTEIRHKDDGPIKQLYEVAHWFAQSAEPFSFSGSKKLLEKEGEDTSSTLSTIKAGLRHPGDVLRGQLGFQPAPAYIQNSPALNKARDYEAENMPPGTRTQAQTDRRQAMNAIEAMFRNRDVNEDTIKRYVEEGKITQQDVNRARMMSKTDPLVFAVRGLSLDQALNVYKEASPKEKEVLRRVLQHKIVTTRREGKAAPSLGSYDSALTQGAQTY